MRPRHFLYIGLIWSIGTMILLAILGSLPPAVVSALASYQPTSLAWDTLTVDHIPLSVIFLPLGIGLDLTVWTLGLIVWAITGGQWPGTALGQAAVNNAVFGWTAGILSGILGGLTIGGIPALIIHKIRSK